MAENDIDFVLIDIAPENHRMRKFRVDDIFAFNKTSRNITLNNKKTFEGIEFGSAELLRDRISDLLGVDRKVIKFA